jgi:hypothetical protein
MVVRDLATGLAWLVAIAVTFLLGLELIAAWSERVRRRDLRRWLEEQSATYPRRR